MLHCAGTVRTMLSFFTSALQMLRKRKRGADPATDLTTDLTTSHSIADEQLQQQQSKRKRQHFAPSDLSAAASKAWCCRAHSGCQAGPSSSEGGCHLARMGSVSLELRALTALSNLAALPSDVLDCISQQLALPVRSPCHPHAIKSQ